MKHKHYEMIVAKAANMDLVIFAREGDRGDGLWHELMCMPRWGDENYFLCLPQHADACLHWLNGGDVQGEDPNNKGVFDDYAPHKDRIHWSSTAWYMREDKLVRIKPKREKRWIVYRNGTVYGPYKSTDDINEDFKRTGQVLEIEVEV